MGSGRGSVSRDVASDTRGPQFDSSLCQNLKWTYRVLTVEKTKIKKKTAGNVPFKKQLTLASLSEGQFA